MKKTLLEIYEKAARLLPEESDFDFIVGRFYAQKSEFKKDCLSSKKEPFIARNPWERQLWDGGHRGSSGSLGAACLVLLPDRRFGRMRKVLHRSFESQSIYSVRPGAAASRVSKRGWRRPGKCRAGGCFLERLYNMDQLKDRLLLMRAAREAGDSRLEELIRKKCSGIELQCFDKAMEQHGKKAET